MQRELEISDVHAVAAALIRMYGILKVIGDDSQKLFWVYL